MKRRIKKLVALFATAILLCSTNVLAAESVSSDSVSISEENIEETETGISETPDSETEDEQNADFGETETELTENATEDPVETDDESEEDTAEGENTEDLGSIENGENEETEETDNLNDTEVGTENSSTDEVDETCDDTDTDTDDINPEEPPELAPPIKHDHEWGETWSYDEKFHWHECGAADCPITEDSEKDGYAPHIFGEWVTTGYDGSEDESKSRECTICGCRQTAGLRPPGCGDGCVYVPDIEEAFLIEIIDEPSSEESNVQETVANDETVMNNQVVVVTDEYVPLQVFRPTGSIRSTTTSDNADAIPTVVKKQRPASSIQVAALSAEKRETTNGVDYGSDRGSDNLHVSRETGDLGRSGDSETRQVALVDGSQSPIQAQFESQPVKSLDDTLKVIIAIVIVGVAVACGFAIRYCLKRKISSRK